VAQGTQPSAELREHRGGEALESGTSRVVAGATKNEYRLAGHFVPVFMSCISHPGFLRSQIDAPSPMALSLRFSVDRELGDRWKPSIVDHDRRTHGTSAGIAAAGL
jgi:hypothetical protein